MKKSLIKFFDKLLIAILTCIGLFAACDDDKTEDCGCTKYTGGSIPMYGITSVNFCTYKIAGTVKNSSSKPVENIRIVRESEIFDNDTIYTDANGKYVLMFYDNPTTLVLEDIDGKENGGEFKTKEIDVFFTNADKVKNSRGLFEKTKNIELTTK
jgi:putative lipoprotein (rSAM/lipoprotein system)